MTRDIYYAFRQTRDEIFQVEIAGITQIQVQSHTMWQIKYVYVPNCVLVMMVPYRILETYNCTIYWCTSSYDI